MKTLIAAAGLSLVLLFAGQSFASDGPNGNPSETFKGGPAQQEKMVDAKGKKISVVNFDDAVIEGKARGPDGFVLRSREASGSRSVLELRRDFRAETLSDALGGIPVVPSLP